jgi:hypothetical protein
MKHLSLLLLPLSVGLLPAQNVLLPDNHHLGESTAQVFGSGTTVYFGTTASVTGRRIQVQYDASHFTGVGGVTGPIVITHVKFRGEDTEHNVGGQTFTNVVASVYSTSLASTAALSTTFATNLLPATSTLLGTVTIPLLTAGAASGKAPNDYVIDLDFSGVSMLPFDPTLASTQRNILVDVAYASQAVAPPPTNSIMMQIQDTAGTSTSIRGRALYAASGAALTGTSSTLPPVMKIEFLGAGGYANLTPARNEKFGAACGGQCSAFYQLFTHNQYFDLKDPGQFDGLTGLRLTPDTYPNPNFYVVTGGAAPVDLTNGLGATPVSIADDATVAFGPIPAFFYPGGPANGTTAIRPSTNGYVIVDPTSTETASDFSPTLGEFLGSTTAHQARFCPFWHDLAPNKNVSLDPTSGLHAVINPANPTEVLVTWQRVGRFNSTAAGQEFHTMQVSLNTASGVVEFRYGPMDEIWGDTFTTSTATGGTSGITGFTRGFIGGVASRDPQSRDLSVERGFATQIEGATGNMGQFVVASPVVQGPYYGGRAFNGQTLRWNVTNVPVGSVIGVQLLDTSASQPGNTLPFLVAPGCMLSTSASATLWEVTLLPGTAVTGTVGLPIVGNNLLGVDLFAQYVVLDGLLVPGSPIITSASNAIRTTLGLQ